MWLKDPETKKPSVQLTAFVIGFIICVLKLAFSKAKIGSVTMDDFSGSDFSMAIAALGAIYSLHTHVQNIASKPDQEPK